MFSDIRRLQELEKKCCSGHDESPPLSSVLQQLSFVSSLADDVKPSSTGTSDPSESERDRYLRSLGYTRYDDPYMLPTS